MTKKTKNNNSAFTLIEMILGLSIFSLIALSLYGTFSSGIRLSKRTEGDNAVYREMQMCFDVFSRDLENSVYYDFSASYPELPVFLGKKDRVTFLTSSSDGIKAVRYYLEPLEFGSVYQTIIGEHLKKNKDISLLQEERQPSFALVREEIPFVQYLQGQEADNGQKEILSPHIQKNGLAFLFAYAQGEGEDRQIVWKDSWQEGLIPSGVRMALVLVNPSRKEQLSVHRDVYVPHGYLVNE